MIIKPAANTIFLGLLAMIFTVNASFWNRGPVTQTAIEESIYTAFDDASWAITNFNLSNKLGDKQSQYDAFMVQCIKSAPPGKGEAYCERQEMERMQRNFLQPQAVRNYTEMGFKKIKAPDEVYSLIKQFWDRNHDKMEPEFNQVSPYHNSWDAPPSILQVANETLEGGGPPLLAAISNAARGVLQEWTGQTLAPSSVYGIRIYKNSSILSPHVDRIPLICSAIINVDQDVDEDWPLEVYDRDGVAHNVTMKPGEMVLYESHSTIHGRPFSMNGRFYANIFVHFEPLGDLKSMDSILPKGQLPPYLIEGSEWEKWYRAAYPDGWNILSDIVGLIHRGDIETLRYIAKRDIDMLNKVTNNTDNFHYLHAAVEAGHLDVTKFFLEEVGTDVNTPMYIPYGVTPLDIALRRFRGNKSNPVVKFLIESGGQPFRKIHGFQKPGTLGLRSK